MPCHALILQSRVAGRRISPASPSAPGALGQSLSSFPTKPSHTRGAVPDIHPDTFKASPAKSYLKKNFFFFYFWSEFTKNGSKSCFFPPRRARTFVWAGKSGATAELEGGLCFRASNPTNLLMHRQSKCQTNEIPAYAFKGEKFQSRQSQGNKVMRS